MWRYFPRRQHEYLVIFQQHVSILNPSSVTQEVKTRSQLPGDCTDAAVFQFTVQTQIEFVSDDVFSSVTHLIIGSSHYFFSSLPTFLPPTLFPDRLGCEHSASGYGCVVVCYLITVKIRVLSEMQLL